MKYLQRSVKNIALLCTGGFLYMFVELLFRGYTYPLMGLVGGIAFLLIGQINTKRNIGLLWQGLIGTAIITMLELIVGSILLKHGIRMWDYSERWMNYKGIICPIFTFLWFWISIAAAWLDDTLRCLMYYEPKRRYTIL